MSKIKVPFYNMVASALAEASDRAVLVGPQRTLSGAEILAETEHWAAALAVLGVRQGDRVAVQAPKSLELVLLYLGVLRLGAVYVPLNSGYRTSEIDYFLADAEPALFVCDPADCGAYETMARERNVRLATLGEEGQGTLRDAILSGNPPAPEPDLGDGDLAAIVYTSGTTGRSKGAMVTQANLLSNARALAEAWGVTRRDVLLHALPLFHIHGLFVALNTLLIAGGRIELMPAFSSEAVARRLPSATLFMGVPTYYTRLLAEPGFDRASTAGVRLFVCGSAPLTPATFEAFEARTGHRILERYGMSECGIICSNPLDGPRLPGAVGRPLPGIEVRIAEGAPVGVLEVRGPNVCAGYWRQPEKTRAEFRDDGFFVTGDVATIDEAGVVRIVGREKDMIISGGLNIYPKEIELAIDAFAEVDESAVIGLPHPDFGEAVAAVVRLHPGAVLDGPALIARLKDDLAGFKIPKAVFLVEELPRNAMGKVQKAALREAHRDHFGG